MAPEGETTEPWTSEAAGEGVFLLDGPAPPPHPVSSPPVATAPAVTSVRRRVSFVRR